MAVSDVKFSNFADGGDLELNDVVVGLRGGVNTRFNYTASPGIYLPLAGGTMAGAIDMDGNSITGLPTPTLPSDAVPLSYLSALVSPSALTRVDDTNVTLTLGGTPATALLEAVSLTLGWTGLLSLTRGGTNASLVASNGGIVYSTATAFAILSGTATAGQILRSGSSAAPSWSTATYPDTAGTVGNVLKSDGTNFVSAADTPGALTENHIYVGDASNVAQDVAMSGDATIVASGALTIANNAVSNAKLAQMAANTIKGNNTAGLADAVDLTVAQTKTLLGYASSGANSDITSMTGLTGVLQAPTGIKSSSALDLLTFTYTASAVNYIDIKNNITSNYPGITATGSDASVGLDLISKGGIFQFYDVASPAGADSQVRIYSGAGKYVGLKAPSSIATSLNFVLPNADGAKNSVLTTDGSKNLSFVDSALKVWCNKVGNSTTINASLNVSSTTHAATGVHVINFTTSFANTSYVTTANSLIAATLQFCIVQSQATGSVSINTYNTAGTLTDPTQLLVMCAGTQ